MRLIMGSLVLFACLLSPRAGMTDDAKKAASPPPVAAKPNTKPSELEQLRAENASLRTENASLKKQLADMKASEEERRKRMEKSLGNNQPATQLK